MKRTPTRDQGRRIRTIHRLVAAVSVGAAVLAFPVAGSAAGWFAPQVYGPAGMVPANGPGPAGHAAAPRAGAVQIGAANTASSTVNLTWHGGPVMHSNTTYTIFWSPGGTISSMYQGTINQFFADVAHDSGASSNVYSTDPQYTDGSGTAAYSSTFGGTWVDTSTQVPDHCSSEYSGTGVTVAGCVLDADLQAEVSRAMAANGWTPGATKLFLVFTPRNVGSCFNGTTKECAYSSYCAYHSAFTASGGTVAYTNQPYTDTSGVGAPGVCDSGEQPNGSWADATINVASHEQNEAVTDPLITAWYDANGNEIGDKCAWNFGAPLGGSPGSNGSEGTQWNQLINGHRYYLQQEWSNASSGCVQAATLPPAPVIAGFSPASGGTGAAVTISGTNLTGATAVTFNGTPASFTVASATSISTVVPAGATSGSVTVATSGGKATSTSTFTVVPSPTIGSFTPGSGAAATPVTITGTNLTGATQVAFNGTSASFTVASATSISTAVPAGATSGSLTVVTPGGKATSTSTFTVLPSPTIGSFTPGSGAAATPVTITGTNLTGATAVKFNGTSASFTVASATSITTKVPSGATSGAITITTPAGTATSSTQFIVPLPPTISSFTPGTGAAATSVTITGTNLTGANAVKFNGTSASFTVASATSITTKVPSGATSGAITVTTAAGTATSSTQFIVPVPDFSLSVSPSARTLTRGSSTTFTVTITRLGGFNGSVSLGLSGLLGGASAPSASFSPTTISSSATSSTLTISTKSTTVTSSTTLTITGTSSSLKHSTTVGLTVQ